METVLAIVLGWIILSIPVSLVVGRFLAGRRAATTEHASYSVQDDLMNARLSGTPSVGDLAPAPEQ